MLDKHFNDVSSSNKVFSTIKAQGYAITEACLLYTSDAADELDGVDLGGRRIIKKKTL
ncbi:hypothetical protein JMUB7518_27960 [Staphylococcus aureus]